MSKSKPRTHCAHGHDFATHERFRWNGTGRTVRYVRYCGVCWDEKNNKACPVVVQRSEPHHFSGKRPKRPTMFTKKDMKNIKVNWERIVLKKFPQAPDYAIENALKD